MVTVTGAGAGDSDFFNGGASSPFREQINNIGTAGCAEGLADSGFHPRDNAIRQQVAYWTNNCGGD